MKKGIYLKELAHVITRLASQKFSGEADRLEAQERVDVVTRIQIESRGTI